MRDGESLLGGGVGDHRVESPRVADDGNARSGRQRLVVDELGDVDEVVDALRTDDTGLREKRLEGLGFDPGRSSAVPGRNGARRARLDRDDRLAHRQLPSDAGELTRVAERLQVQPDRAGLVVVDEVLHEVVAGDVDTVARRGEHRHAQPTARSRGEESDAETPTLAEQSEGPRVGCVAGDRGREPGIGVVVEQAEGVGTDDTHAVVAGAAEQLALTLLTLGARLGEPGGEHEQGLDPGLGTVVDDAEHPLGRNGDDGHVDTTLDVADP